MYTAIIIFPILLGFILSLLVMLLLNCRKDLDKLYRLRYDDRKEAITLHATVLETLIVLRAHMLMQNTGSPDFAWAERQYNDLIKKHDPAFFKDVANDSVLMPNINQLIAKKPRKEISDEN